MKQKLIDDFDDSKASENSPVHFEYDDEIIHEDVIGESVNSIGYSQMSQKMNRRKSELKKSLQKHKEKKIANEMRNQNNFLYEERKIPSPMISNDSGSR